MITPIHDKYDQEEDNMNGRDGNNMSLEFKPNMVQSLYLDLAFG